jgi:hypothetical protein
MLMQIKHYRFEPMDETTVTSDLLINTDHIIRVNRAACCPEHNRSFLAVPFGELSSWLIVNGRSSTVAILQQTKGMKAKHPMRMF